MTGVDQISIYMSALTATIQKHKLTEVEGRLICRIDFETNNRPERIQYFIYEEVLSDLLYIYNYDGENYTITLFNALGHYFQWVYEENLLREARSLKPNGDVKVYWRFLYNPENLLTTITKLNPSGTQEYEVLRLYNSKNQLVEYREVAVDGLYAWHQYAYDESGNRVKSEIKMSSNYYGSKHFKPDGSILDTPYWNANFYIKVRNGGWWEYTYDDSDNLIESRAYKPKGKLQCRIENEFDAKGQLLRTTQLSKRGVEKEIRRVFNLDGTLLSEVEILPISGKTKWELGFSYSEGKPERITFFNRPRAQRALFTLKYKQSD